MVFYAKDAAVLKIVPVFNPVSNSSDGNCVGHVVEEYTAVKVLIRDLGKTVSQVQNR